MQQVKNSGSALPLALLVIALLLIVGAGLLGLGLTYRFLSTRNTAAIAARCAADAGLTEALFKMNQKLQVKPWNPGTLPEAINENLPYCNALYSYAVTGDLGSGYQIESTGTCGRNQKTITCSLQLQGPFEAAIFTQQGVELKNSAIVDWYNHTPDDQIMKIGTNSIIPGTIIFRNSSVVYGDVLVGLGGNPAVVIEDYGATISGETRALTQKYPMPSIWVPEWLLSLANGGTIQNDTIISSSAKYDSIDLKNNKTITIEGDVVLYVIGGMILNNSAELVIENDASLVLYLGGNFEGKNSSDMNNQSHNAEKLQIYCLDSCESMVFKNSSDFYGAIYAPNADIVMDNSADIYGAVIARSFEQKNSARFNYDTLLRDADTNDEAVRFVITDWHEQ
jgi:hypothetical protein